MEPAGTALDLAGVVEPAEAVDRSGDGDNPLDVADGLGRPMAILRIGGRLPDASGPDEVFLYGSPPLLRWRAHAQPVMNTASDEGPSLSNHLQRVEPIERSAPIQRAAAATYQKPLRRIPTR